MPWSGGRQPRCGATSKPAVARKGTGGGGQKPEGAPVTPQSLSRSVGKRLGTVQPPRSFWSFPNEPLFRSIRAEQAWSTALRISTSWGGLIPICGRPRAGDPRPPLVSLAGRGPVSQDRQGGDRGFKPDALLSVFRESSIDGGRRRFLASF